MPLPTLTLYAPAPGVSAALDTRQLAGVALPYGVPGRTSAGTVTVAAGAVDVPAELRRVKLFTEHGRTTPVGYATGATAGTDALRMSFRVAATPDGDTALLEAAEGVRDALSVELSDVTISAGVVTSARLDAVALVALPAFDGARLAAAADTEPAEPAEPAEQLELVEVEPAEPAEPADDTDTDTDTEETAVQPTTVVNVTAPPAPPTTAGRRRGRAGIDAGIAELASVIGRSSDAAQVNAALSDITPPVLDPTGDAQGYLVDTWVGELWTPYLLEQTILTAIGPSLPLTSSKVHGWKWETLPEVGPYAGNKAEIPSNTVKIVPAEASAYRLAGGWDVDRILVDLGQNDFLARLLDLAAQDLAAKFEASVAATLLAAATDAGDVADVLAGVATVVSTLVAAGAAPNTVAISPDLFASLLSGPTAADAPWWLAGAGVISLASPSAGVADLTIRPSSGLPAGTVLGIDRRSATHYQASARVQAINVAQAGIDVALYAYGADLISDARGLAVATVPPALP